MASLASPTATALQFRHSDRNLIWSLSRRNFTFVRFRCNALFNDNPLHLDLDLERSLSQLPALQQLTGAADLPEVEKWGLLVLAGVTWIYLTARPGVLMGAIDAYVLAPLQLGLDTLSGRRSLKRTDFLVGDRLGEGSFGIVYSGVVVPKNVNVDDNVRRSRQQKIDQRFKEKVILKKVLLSQLLLLINAFLTLIQQLLLV